MLCRNFIRTIPTVKFGRPNLRNLKSTMVTASSTQEPVLIYDLLPAPGGCPYAQRAKVVLREKNIAHVEKLIDPQNKPEDFLALFRKITSNPNGRGTVPTIIESDVPADNGVELTESAVVSEYLDTKYTDGPKLFPTDPAKLAKVKLFVELYTAEVQSQNFKILTANSQEEVDAGKEGLTKGLKVLDTFLRDHALEGGDFLLGKDFSYAEIASIPFLHRFNVILPYYQKVDPQQIMKENGFDRLEKWIQAAEERPSVKVTTVGDEALITGFKKWVKPAFSK